MKECGNCNGHAGFHEYALTKAASGGNPAAPKLFQCVECGAPYDEAEMDDLDEHEGD